MLMSEIAKELGTNDVTTRAVLVEKGIKNPARHTAQTLLKQQVARQHSGGELRELTTCPQMKQSCKPGPHETKTPSFVKPPETMPPLARTWDRLVEGPS